MAFNFPSTPTDGQQFTSGNLVWQYSSASGAWIITANNSFYTPVTKTASYTVAAFTDAQNVFLMNVATANNLLIPTDATLNFALGTQIQVIQIGAGQTTIAAVTPGTTTIRATPGAKVRAQYSMAGVIKIAANEWVVFGDTVA